MVMTERTCVKLSFLLRKSSTGALWLTSIILATQEAEIRRIMVQRQPRRIVHEILSQK
jgi:hypothetical protein